VIVLHHGALLAEGSPQFVRNHPEVLSVYLAGIADEAESETAPRDAGPVEQS
jgi:hypothetical protein